MKNGWQFVLFEHLVYRPRHAVVWLYPSRWEGDLKPLTPNSLIKRTHRVFVHVNAGEGDHNVAVGLGRLGDFYVRNAQPYHL